MTAPLPSRLFSAPPLAPTA